MLGLKNNNQKFVAKRAAQGTARSILDKKQTTENNHVVAFATTTHGDV